MTQRKYKDFDMSFKRHPVTGDIGSKSDIESIKQSVRNLIRTSPYDRKFHPEIGARIKNILFSDISSVSVRMLRRMVTEVITNHEPRVQVSKVHVSYDGERTHYKVTVVFRVINVANPISVSAMLSRIR